MAEKRVLYNMKWEPLMAPALIERDMIRRGGKFQKSNGEWAGEGLFFHHKRLQQLLCPEKVWHRWNDLLLAHFIEYRIIGVMGAASTGKSREACDFARSIYYCWPECSTIICSSTERETLEDRIWGEIKSEHRKAKRLHPWIPGTIIDSRQRLVTGPDDDEDEEEGRDFRNGMVGVPCKKGGSYVGMGSYSGRKNKIVVLVCDEGQFMPRAYVDAISNLNKNTTFYCIVLGNPKETTDALGLICEPAAELGGWDGGIDQQPGTKTWKTKWDRGICIQLVGTDSPNLDGNLGIPLITQAQIDSDVRAYGRDSLQFTMMNEGRMPRGQGLRRVITRQMCLKFGAMEEPIWKGTGQTKIGFLDAAYGAVGGDRCIFGELQFGESVEGGHILALIDIMAIPVSVKEDELPEDQIVRFVRETCEIRNIPAENFYFDSTGRGSLMSAFARLWSNMVNGVEFGGRASDRPVSNEIQMPCKDYYFNFVSELWYSIRHIIESRQFRGMTEDVMMEGCMREWAQVGANKVQVEPKENMKEKMNRSPDLFDALVAGVEGARRRGFIIKRLTNPSYVPPSGEWQEKVKAQQAKLRSMGKLNYAA